MEEICPHYGNYRVYQKNRSHSKLPQKYQAVFKCKNCLFFCWTKGSFILHGKANVLCLVKCVGPIFLYTLYSELDSDCFHAVQGVMAAKSFTESDPG